MKSIKITTMNENSNQRRIIYDSEYLSPTLQAAMGNGGGNTPLVIEDDEKDNGNITNIQ